MRKVLLSLFVVSVALWGSAVHAMDLSIDKYPTTVESGESADILVSWKDAPSDKEFKLIVQLENWDVKPGICVVTEKTEFRTNGKAVISLDIPGNTPAAADCRFLVAFLSKTEGWDNALAPVVSTEKDVMVGSMLRIEDYPKVVKAGTNAMVKLSWKKIPTKGDYKLIVQLENWDVKPGICYVTDLNSFKARESRTITVPVPANAKGVKECRFVAAFISTTTGWDDVFAMGRSNKEVTIEKQSTQ
ncbi:MAG: hypothetical protein P9M03_01740 [Candidatus Theseobacter exili]|nr:hypothetical protein [Candidatus Theseobacter exili]